ncbi:hypothetical protein LAUMK35_00220 [Mycobacterium pseudokansasii]|uniref:Uncharacterized protein n=1 Tax=Mycobacterium pseudokansasii TaxID=2341080 RepID=A0A498QND7_9MYCO|nr:hypothetical protein LAUMK35_00220 [Mycobacterium pseudokansasii]VAZ87832.1 hypothetical protein LAUMK21_00218 [Mycobacterium pseudokansasii]VBA45661.1 hypothetical protein LAUMK142_00077 [Mycobacterium pseudokansasii]
MVCAYPLTPVLNGVCKTCGSMRAVAISLQINAVQRHTYCVDNNLPGVSGQVTASGVLVFAEIFGELSLGNGERAKTPSEKFASGNLFGNALGRPAAGYGQPRLSYRPHQSLQVRGVHQVGQRPV